MSALALSVLLSLVSAVAYAGGAIVQERVAVTTPEHDVRTAAPARSGGCAVGAQRPRRAPARGGARLRPAEPGPAAGRADHRVRASHGGRSSSAARPGRPPGAARSWPRWASPVCSSLVGSSDSQSLNSTQRVVVALVTGGAVVALMMARPRRAPAPGRAQRAARGRGGCRLRYVVGVHEDGRGGLDGAASRSPTFRASP